LLCPLLARVLLLHRDRHLDPSLQNSLLIVGLVAQAAVRRHCVMRATTDAMACILRLVYLNACLCLEVLARHVARVLLRTVGQRRLIDWPARVLHAYIIGVSLLLATLMTSAFHGEP